MLLFYAYLYSVHTKHLNFSCMSFDDVLNRICETLTDKYRQFEGSDLEGETNHFRTSVIGGGSRFPLAGMSLIRETWRRMV